MENTEWESIVLDVTEYLEAATGLEDGLSQVIQLNLSIGTNNPEERPAALGALKALLRGRDGTPFRKGKKPAVPTAVRVAIDRICGVVSQSSMDYFNSDEIIASVTFARGGALYESAEDYAASVVKRTRNALVGQYKEGSWDGSVESLLSESEE
jgi:hypothetical protein